MNQQGDVAEMIFALEARKRNFEIFLPMSHATKIDVAIRKPGHKLIGVQIKKAARQKSNGKYCNSWKFMVGSGLPSSQRRVNNTGRPRYTKYKKGDFDVIAAWINEESCWAFYDLRELAGKASKRWSVKNGIKNNWELFNNI